MKNVDWKKVAVTAGAIGVGIALTVATGGLGAPVAMAIGGAASGAIISGYDAYSSGQRGWELVGSIAKGAGTGAISGLIGGQLMGAGAGLATNVTQNIGNQAVRQVAKIGVEFAVETAIDTGIDLATGNKITGQTVAMNFAFNTFTNGAGSVSPKKAPKADVVTTKPKSEDVAVTRPRKDVTPVQQLALPGPTSKPLALPAPDPVLALPAPKTTAKPDFYVKPSGDVIPATSPYSYLQDSNYVGVGKKFTATQKEAIIKENMVRNGGVVRSDLSGEILYRPQKSQKGVTPNPNEWQIDHIIPKTKGGSNSYANAQVLSRFENRMKSDYYSGGD